MSFASSSSHHREHACETDEWDSHEMCDKNYLPLQLYCIPLVAGTSNKSA